MKPDSLASAAQALVGVPFRLHGRDPQTGLDCIGVLAASLAACGRPADLPLGYALRTRVLPRLDPFVHGSGLIEAAGSIRPGDIVLLRVGPGQIHLAIAASEGRFIHAHAGRRRVVCDRLLQEWTVAGHWRLAPAD